MLNITINDDGVGISEDNVSRLFQIAENQSTSDTENEKETGLGLILCKEFIEKTMGKFGLRVQLVMALLFSFHYQQLMRINDL